MKKKNNEKLIHANDYRDNKEELAKIVKVGMWGSHCCEQDIYQIENQEELQDILDDDDEDDCGFLFQYVFAETYDELYQYFTT